MIIEGFQMTVESNHVIALVLGPSFSCFSHCL